MHVESRKFYSQYKNDGFYGRNFSLKIVGLFRLGRTPVRRSRCVSVSKTPTLWKTRRGSKIKKKSSSDFTLVIILWLHRDLNKMKCSEEGLIKSCFEQAVNETWTQVFTVKTGFLGCFVTLFEINVFIEVWTICRWRVSSRPPHHQLRFWDLAGYLDTLTPTEFSPPRRDRGSLRRSPKKGRSRSHICLGVDLFYHCRTLVFFSIGRSRWHPLVHPNETQVTETSPTSPLSLSGYSFCL